MVASRLVPRIRLIIGAVLAVSLILIGRLYQVQVVNGAEYTEDGNKQYVRHGKDFYSRGSIFFTTKDGEKMSAASIRAGYALVLNPQMMADGSEEKVCSALEPYFLTITKERCLERASFKNRVYVELETNILEDEATKIREFKFAGVQLFKNQWRYYPGGNLLSRVIGFVGYADDGQLHGLYGLERFYDKVLMRNLNVRSVNLFAEIFSNLGNPSYEREENKKGDIVTTIEPTVAAMLDGVLQDTNDLYNSKITGGIVMDPQTGAIYAMDVVPSFDLNNRGTSTVSEFSNPLVEDVYEFGSIIKALTMAAGLDSGAVTPQSTYYDAGRIVLDKYTISNYDGRGRGQVDMQQVLNQSLNTGVSHIVQQMGKGRFRDYFLKFKLGSKTGVDQPNEVSGLVDNLRSPRDVEYATASFGQGIANTPIETVRALAILGNGGYLVTPHLVSRIEYDDGTVDELEYPKGEQVISEKTSEEISRMLTKVVDQALAYGKYSSPTHTIGAKTGTAQMANPNGRGYYDDRYLHSFFGYFPAYDPKFIVFLYTVEPKGVQYASETLTKPFMDITNFLINYYNVPPDR